VDQLRAAIYPDVPAALAWAADNNVRAHLLKLWAEGRVTESGATWAPCQGSAGQAPGTPSRSG
jgi:hypothetical protein